MAFFIPALVGGAKALAATGIKKAAISAVKNKVVDAAKKFVKGKGKKGKRGVASKGGALVRSVGKGLVKSGSVGSSFIPKGGALVKSPSGSISTTSGEGGTSFEAISTTLDSIVGLTSQIEKIAESQYKNRKAANQEARKEKDKAKKEKREDQLERNKNIPGSNLLGNVAKKANEFGLGKFLMNILMGGVALALFNNFNKIKKIFDTISTALTSPEGLLNLLRIGILSLNSIFKETAKKIDDVFGKVLKNLGKKLAKISKEGIGPSIKTGFKKLSNGIEELGRSAVRRVKNLTSGVASGLGGTESGLGGTELGLRPGNRGATRVTAVGPRLRGVVRGKGATRATGVAKRAFRRGAAAANNIVPFTRPSSPTPLKPRNIVDLKGTKFAQSGLKRLGKVRGIFGNIPIVGSLLGIGIDLALGERLDNAVAGAIGASIGAPIGVTLGASILGLIGAVLGGGILSWAIGPIMAKLGAVLGGFIGGWVGDWLGKTIWKNITKQNESLFEGVAPPTLDPNNNNNNNNTSTTLPGSGNYTPPSTSGMKTSSTLGYQYTIPQLVQLALSVGFKGNNAAIAAAIAFAESRGWSANDTIKSGLFKLNGETSYGLWQINMTGSLGPVRRKKWGLSSNEELYDPNTNAKIAYKMSGGSNFSAWTAYEEKTPQYQDALPKAQAALAQLQQQQSTQSSSLNPGDGTFEGEIRKSTNRRGRVTWKKWKINKDGEGSWWTQTGPNAVQAKKDWENQQKNNQLTSSQNQVVTQLGPTTPLTSSVTKLGPGTQVSGHQVISGFGPRWGGEHHGLDIDMPENTYIAFKVPGVVKYSNRRYGDYGLLMDVYLPSASPPVYMRLAHLNKCLKNAGDQVPAGVPVAKSGGKRGDPNAGNSRGPHLHWEANKVESADPSPEDPSPWAKYLILSKDPPTAGTISPGNTTPVATPVAQQQSLSQQQPHSQQPQSAQIQPGTSGSTAGQSANAVSSQASYERAGGGNVVVTLPGGGQVQGQIVSGGSQGSPIIMADPASILNSYYKAQLLGFLYKQG